ncbi:hypothetical protein HPB48_023982 [Haemaphysalis longicornis]|uniref:Uncharacterized protein n=1 Tax=Haemaphysalis longicornis TaxID=44386 RepID=A0A9J6H795_HAELO|nr:hypothetical protein HPB48_023982 [Haemaphysalis longicornis]
MKAPRKAVEAPALGACFEGTAPKEGELLREAGTEAKALASRARGRRRGDGGCSISPSGAAAFSVAKSMPAEGRRRVLSLAPFSFKVGLAPRPDRESTLAYIATDATAKDGEGLAFSAGFAAAAAAFVRQGGIRILRFSAPTEGSATPISVHARLCLADGASERPSPAGASAYSMVPTTQGQQGPMISPPPPGAPQDSMYNMSMNGGDSYQNAMGANVQSQRTLARAAAYLRQKSSDEGRSEGRPVAAKLLRLSAASSSAPIRATPPKPASGARKRISRLPPQSHRDNQRGPLLLLALLFRSPRTTQTGGERNGPLGASFALYAFPKVALVETHSRDPRSEGQRQCRVVVACRPNRRLFVKTERGTRYAGPPLFPPFLFSPGRGRGGKAATKCKYGHRCARVRVFVLCAGRAVVLPAAGKKSTGPTGERRRHDATTATAAADPARCLPVLLLFRTRPWLRDTRRSASASFAFLFTAIQKSYGQWTTLGREAVREACHAASRRALV